MFHKIVRADGETIVTEFKTFRFVEQVNEENNLRYGSVISSYIEAEIYNVNNDEIQDGEELTYYQVFDTDDSFNLLPAGQFNEIKIGIFTANIISSGKKIYSLRAYDNIAKLDVDFSGFMKEHVSQFPMSVANIVSLISSLIGVNINISQCPLHYLSPDVSVYYFYSDGITCRQMISYIAEVSSCNIYCLPNGTIYAQPYINNRSLTIPPPDFYWKDNEYYIICPTDQVTYTAQDSLGRERTLIPVFYKENGFNKAGFTCEALDTFSIRKTDGTNVWSMTGSNVDDVYEINSNPVVDFLMLSDMVDWDDIMMVVEGDIEDETLRGIVPFEIHLFPFRNPFRAGEYVPYIEGTDGVRFRSLIMKMEVTDSEAILYCYGNEKWHVSSQLLRTADEANAAMSAQINQRDIIRFGDNVDDNYFVIGSFADFNDYNEHCVVYSGLYNTIFIQACEYWWSFDSFGNTILPKPLGVSYGGTGASSASNALTNLGAVAKSGDTMTGNLFINRNILTSSPYLVLKNPSYTIGVAPKDASDNAVNVNSGVVAFRGSTDDNMGYFSNTYTGGRSSQTKMTASNKVNGAGSAITNQLTLSVNNAGVRSISFSELDPWLDALKITPTQKSITIPTTMPSGINSIGYVHVIQSGATVYVEAYIVRNTTDTGSNWGSIATGLPAPMLIDSTPIYQYFVSATKNEVRPLFIRITSSGALQFSFGQATSGTSTYRFTLTYMTKNI